MPSTLVVTFLSLSFYMAAWASMAVDQQYAFKNVIAITLNTDTQAVTGKQVEESSLEVLKRLSRFELMPQLREQVNEAVKPIQFPETKVTEDLDYLLAPYTAAFQALAQSSLDAIFLTQLRITPEGHNEIWGALINVHGPKLVHTANLQLPDAASLEQIKLGTESIMQDLIKAVPFDATVIRREGYRVILDVGQPIFRRGMRLPTFTLEPKDKAVVFNETGSIVLTHVDDSLSFGLITVEKKPLEVEVGNKIQANLNALSDVAPPRLISSEGVTSADLGTSSRFKGRVGYLDLDLGPSLVSLNSKTGTGAISGDSSGMIFPRGNLMLELWMTNQFFFNFGIQFGRGTLGTTGTTTDSSTSFTDIKAMMGYRYYLGGIEGGPNLYAKLGYMKSSFVFDTSTSRSISSAGFSELSHSGIYVSGGAHFPLSDNYGLILDVGTLLMKSAATENPATAVTNPFAWEMSFRGYYNLAPEIDLGARLLLAQQGGTIGSTNHDIFSRGLLASVLVYF